MRLVFNFSMRQASSRITMDTSAVSTFVENHNSHIKIINQKMRPYSTGGNWTVIEMLDICDPILKGIEGNCNGLKEWCRRFYHDNKPILWLFRVYALGNISLDKIQRGHAERISDEFKMPGFQIFFEPNLQFKEYSFSFTDAIDYARDLEIKIPLMPDIRAIHEGIECEDDYDWWDECGLCFKKKRAIEDRFKELLAQSNNIFLNSKIRQKVFQEFLAAVRDNTLPSAFHDAIKQWNILPILDVLPYASDGKYNVTDRGILIKRADAKIEDAFKPGKTPRQITDSWLSSIITHYYYFNIHYSLDQSHDPLFSEYELFFKVFYSIEAMDLLLESQKRCVHMIRDMF